MFAGDFHAATAVIDIFDGISDHHHFPLLFLHVLDLGRISGGVAGGISGGVAAGVAAGVDLGHREELLEGLILLCQVGFRQRLPELPVIVVSSPVMFSTFFNKHVGIKATQVTATRSTSTYRSLKKMGMGRVGSENPQQHYPIDTTTAQHQTSPGGPCLRSRRRPPRPGRAPREMRCWKHCRPPGRSQKTRWDGGKKPFIRCKKLDFMGILWEFYGNLWWFYWI